MTGKLFENTKSFPFEYNYTDLGGIEKWLKQRYDLSLSVRYGDVMKRRGYFGEITTNGVTQRVVENTNDRFSTRIRTIKTAVALVNKMDDE